MNKLEKIIGSRLREREQFNLILDVIYYMTVILFYDFTHTNILTRWSRPIWICLIQIQNYTSISDPLYNKVIHQSLKHHSCWIISISINIKPSLVPCSWIFTWEHLTYVHMSWQCIAPDMNHVKVICTRWRVYMNI